MPSSATRSSKFTVKLWLSLSYSSSDSISISSGSKNFVS